jgi:hypothetical protein
MIRKSQGISKGHRIIHFEVTEAVYQKLTAFADRKEISLHELLRRALNRYDFEDGLSIIDGYNICVVDDNCIIIAEIPIDPPPSKK